MGRLDRDPSQAHDASVAAWTQEEALQVFEAIKDNSLLSQVFFELAREAPAGRLAPPIHALNIVDMLRHTRLPDVIVSPIVSRRSIRCFRGSATTRKLRCSASTSSGISSFHEANHHSIRTLWEQLFAAEASRPVPMRMDLRHLGLNEDVASHAPGYALSGNSSR